MRQWTGSVLVQIMARVVDALTARWAACWCNDMETFSASLAFCCSPVQSVGQTVEAQFPVFTAYGKYPTKLLRLSRNSIFMGLIKLVSVVLDYPILWFCLFIMIWQNESTIILNCTEYSTIKWHAIMLYVRRKYGFMVRVQGKLETNTLKFDDRHAV